MGKVTYRISGEARFFSEESSFNKYTAPQSKLKREVLNKRWKVSLKLHAAPLRRHGGTGAMGILA
jgi:hypothetical protein